MKQADFTIGQRVRLSEKGKRSGFGRGGGRLNTPPWSEAVVTSTTPRARGCIRVRRKGSRKSSKSTIFHPSYWELK